MNSPTHIVRVNLSDRSYDIEIGTGTLPGIARLVPERRKVRHAVVITDDNVKDSHAATVAEALAETVSVVDQLSVAAGEEHKSLDAVDKLLEMMLEIGADRQTVVVVVGGGVIGDTAGFVAATYVRGIGFYQVPTTLLAQVDSSVGGKVGVNLRGGKNMAGAFWQPQGVLIDTAVLNTLPDRQYRAGLAEVVKYGVILDAPFFDFLEQHVADLNARDPAVLRQIIARSCQLKADVVSQDEREETGQRAVLNYGHTYCHAFETLTGYSQILHGEGVSMGMLCASRLAERLGRISPDVTARQHALLLALGLPVSPPDLDPAQVLHVMSRDKKVLNGRLRFVLPTRLGHVELVGGVDPADVLAALAVKG